MVRAVHGAIGIVMQVALSPEALIQDTPPGAWMEKEEIVKSLGEVVPELLDEQRNRPAHLDNPRDTSWCSSAMARQGLWYRYGRLGIKGSFQN